MENQDRFDLEQALGAWRDDCASRPSISLDNARELESDLRERVADLLKQGMNEREAFSKAVEQVGTPGELAREFARENPLAVWRERLFWIIAAGFAVSVWGMLTNGPLLWLLNNFRGGLIPFVAPTWLAVAGQLPVLAMAVLLATGRPEKLGARLRFFSRRGVALTGVCFLVVGVIMGLFGPHSLPGHGPLLAKALMLALWPLLLLCLIIGLFRPTRVPAGCGFGASRLPAAVWRERVFWMAVGALAVGVWRTVSWATMQALFYTGDTNRPFNVADGVFISSFLLIELSPLVFLGLLLGRRVRAGKDVTARKLVRSRVLFALIPAVVFAWAALQLWSTHYWRPAGISWSSVVANYFGRLQWLWPAGLACLILWLAPRRETRTSESLATAVD